jgi:hypothetical protein
VVVPPALKVTESGPVTWHGFGTGVGVGVGVGVTDGVGVAVAVGVGVGVASIGTGVGITVGVGDAPGSGVGTTEGLGVGEPTGVALGVGVAPDARSSILRSTSGTESSNTRLSMVTSPEPVTSTDTKSLLFLRVIETWALASLSEPTVL